MYPRRPGHSESGVVQCPEADPRPGQGHTPSSAPGDTCPPPGPAFRGCSSLSPPCTSAGRWGGPPGRVPPESVPRGCQAAGGLPTPPLGFAGVPRAQVRPAGPPGKTPPGGGVHMVWEETTEPWVFNSTGVSPGPSLGHRPSQSEPRLRSLSLAAWAHEGKAETP